MIPPRKQPPAPQVGVGVILRRAGKILLLRRRRVHGAGSWSTPGGHLDYGESFAECAIRELREETGLEVSQVEFRAITNDVFEAEGKHYITIWMEAHDAGGEAVVNAAEEMSEIAWFSLAELPEHLFVPFENLLHGACSPSQDFLSGDESD